MDKHISVPFDRSVSRTLHAGDYVYLSGTVYVARDAAHKRMTEALDNGGELPFDIRNQTVYYMGPSPERPGCVIGSAGPTTAGRMDRYTPRLIELGMTGMIGKGRRTREVSEAMEKYEATYFAAVGGAGALLSKCITSSSVVAYDDLGTEAVRKLTVEDFPVIVVMDCHGGCLYV